MGDVDLFALAREGEALTVNAKWLQHLEDRLLGEDGHPRKAREGEDPHRCDPATCAPGACCPHLNQPSSSCLQVPGGAQRGLKLSF